jgi:hypothetical protein
VLLDCQKSARSCSTILATIRLTHESSQLLIKSKKKRTVMAPGVCSVRL